MPHVDNRTRQRERAYGEAQKKRRPRRKKSRRAVLVCLIFLLVFSLTAAGYSAYRLFYQHTVKGNSDVSRYAHILSDAEKHEWQTKQAKPQEVFIQVNTRADVSGENRAHLRLINPPYCHFRYHIRLTLKGHTDTLYETDIDPGTVLEYVELAASLAPGEHEAVLRYDFQDSSGAVKGTKEVDVVLRKID